MKKIKHIRPIDGTGTLTSMTTLDHSRTEINDNEGILLFLFLGVENSQLHKLRNEKSGFIF